MGYAYYEITRNGETIQAGYSVEVVCEEDGCDEKIDRGLAHLCGAQPGGDEYGCGGYYCGHHLYTGIGPAEGLCARDSKRWQEQEETAST
ncbi:MULTISPECIES: hypothetical protein [Streptomyces]|uniref:Uncharacterized protein n=2 Tax=Streptomyces TaxID=1883 RepID=A0A2U9NZX1_STRAS|nr:hypothetical protein [Streptomyces actuosus]AWT42574.1 hypothetical protein DMT42_09775 [Streptomyces actuosus]MBM4819781.1 hypothetical protein [Streptomyces actuosus]